MSSKPADWDLTFRVNVMGVVNTVQAFVPLLQRSKEPSVVCPTASVGGVARGRTHIAHYLSSKHAVVCLSESLSDELAKVSPQIRVHVCCPCIVRTGLFVSSMAAKSGRDTGKRAVDGPGTVTEAMAPLGMTPLQHGAQVWDRVAAGEFYMICDSVRPYVDHDFPLGGVAMARYRMEGLVSGKLDNGGGE